MLLFHVVRYRLRALLWPQKFRRERDEEIRHHLALESAGIRGLDDDDAQLAARRQFGNVTYATEERRMIAGLAMFDSAEQDLRFVSRLLRRRATFAAVTVATIALGIGAASSIYSVADAVLFRSLAFPNPDRLMAVHLERPAWKKIADIARRWDRGTVSLPGFRAWRASQHSFDDVAVWNTNTAVVNAASSPEEVTVGHASASLFATLGIRPALGAWISASDDIIGGAPVAVVGFETWTSRFGSDPSVLGKAVDINGTSFTIIGVAPRGLSLDRGPTNVAYWTPAGRDSADANSRSSFPFQAIGRLKPGVSSSVAAAEAGRVFRAESDDDRIEGATIATLHADQTRIVRRPLLILLGAAVLLLVIACINVATLLLGEAVGREQELRTRTALGASRRRLVRQLLTESVVLSSTGAVLGIALASIGTRIIVHSAPPSIPGIHDVHVDARLLIIASIAAIATGVLFGSMPAFLLTRGRTSLGAAGGRLVRGHGRGQRVLIACEIALSMVLLVGAGLLVRSFGKLSSVGFAPSNLYVVALRTPWSPFSDSIHARQLYAEVQQRLRSLPGIAAVTVTTTPPFGGSSSTSYQIEGRPVQRDAGPSAQRRVTSGDFFTVAGIPVISGRGYDETDRAGAPLVVVVNRTLAQREWPNETAIGKRINIMGAPRTVIGVVGDIATERPSADPPETVYAPLAQLMLRGAPTLLVRTRGAPLETADVRRVVESVEADVGIARVSSMTETIGTALADDRLRTVLFALFATLAVALAGVGTYGVAATSANRRMREMAIRIAVGASNVSIARLVVGSAAGGVIAGAVVGLGLAAAGARVLAPYLFGVTTIDPAVYASVTVFLAVATLASTWIPARRAMRVRLVDTLARD